MDRQEFECEIKKEYPLHGTMICGQYPDTIFYSKPRKSILDNVAWIGFYTSENDWGIIRKDNTQTLGTGYVPRLEM